MDKLKVTKIETTAEQYGLNVGLPENLTPMLDDVFRPSVKELAGWRKKVMQVALWLVTGKWEKVVRVQA